MRSQNKPAMLGLERSIVDGLRLGDLAIRPTANRLSRCKADANRIEIIHVENATTIATVATAEAAGLALGGGEVTDLMSVSPLETRCLT